jgi:hypothetical protein
VALPAHPGSLLPAPDLRRSGSDRYRSIIRPSPKRYPSVAVSCGDDYLIDALDDREVLCGNSDGDDAQVRDFPAVKDVVYCGSGRDAAYVDRFDVVNGCGIVRLP